MNINLSHKDGGGLVLKQRENSAAGGARSFAYETKVTCSARATTTHNAISPVGGFFFFLNFLLQKNS